MTQSQYDFLSQGTDLKVRKLLARSYLRDSRLEDALEVYIGILTDVPDDADVRGVFENLYRLAGLPKAPELITREGAAELKETLCQMAVDYRDAADGRDRDTIDEAENSQSESLQQLMPALIELNIRHAREAGRADLAEALQSLQINLSRYIYRQTE